MPKFRLWLQETDSHSGESVIKRLNVRDDAERLLPRFCLE